MVQMRRSKDALFLDGLACGTLPVRIAPENLIAPDARRALAEAIGDVARAYGMDTRRSVVSIAEGVVLLRATPLGHAFDGEIEEQIRWEMEQLLIPPLEDYALDFFQTEARAFLTAIPQTMIDFCLEICDLAKIRPVSLDIDPIALFNALEMAYGFEPDLLGGAISVEEDQAGVVLFQGDRLLAAEIWRFNKNSPSLSRQDQDTPDGESSDRIVGIVRRRLQHLVSQTTDRREAQPLLDRTILCGTGAEALAVSAALDTLSTSPPEVADPFRKFNTGALSEEAYDLLDRSPVFMVSAGLAYRGLGE